MALSMYAFCAVLDPLVKWLHETGSVCLQMPQVYMIHIKNFVIVCMLSLCPLPFWYFLPLKPVPLSAGHCKTVSFGALKMSFYQP